VPSPDRNRPQPIPPATVPGPEPPPVYDFHDAGTDTSTAASASSERVRRRGRPPPDHAGRCGSITHRCFRPSPSWHASPRGDRRVGQGAARRTWAGISSPPESSTRNQSGRPAEALRSASRRQPRQTWRTVGSIALAATQLLCAVGATSDICCSGTPTTGSTPIRRRVLNRFCRRFYTAGADRRRDLVLPRCARQTSSPTGSTREGTYSAGSQDPSTAADDRWCTAPARIREVRQIHVAGDEKRPQAPRSRDPQDWLDGL